MNVSGKRTERKEVKGRKKGVETNGVESKKTKKNHQRPTEIGGRRVYKRLSQKRR